MSRKLLVIWFLIMSLLGTACQGDEAVDLSIENSLHAATQTEILPETLSFSYKEDNFIVPPQPLDLSDMDLDYFETAQRKQSLVHPKSSVFEAVWLDDLYIALVSRDRKESKVYLLPSSQRHKTYSWQFIDVLGDSDLELVGQNQGNLCILSIVNEKIYRYDIKEISDHLYGLTTGLLDGHRLSINVKSSTSDPVGHDYKLMIPDRFDKIDKIWDGKDFKVFPPKIRPLEKLVFPSIDPSSKGIRWDVKWVIDHGMSINTEYYIPLAIIPYRLDDERSAIIEGDIEIRYTDGQEKTLVIPSKEAWIKETQGQELPIMVYDPKDALVSLQAYFGGQDQSLDEDMDPDTRDEDENVDESENKEHIFESDGLSINVVFYKVEDIEIHLLTHAIIKDSRYEVASHFQLGDSKDDIKARLGPPDTIDSEGTWLYYLVNEDGVTIMDYYSREYITFKFSPIIQNLETIEINAHHWFD